MISKASTYAAFYLLLWVMLNNVFKAFGLTIMGYELELLMIVVFILLLSAYAICKSCNDGVLFKVVLALYVLTSLLLLIFTGRGLSFTDTLKGWYGAIAPISILLCVLFGSIPRTRFFAVSAYLFFLMIALGIVLDSTLNLQFGKILLPNNDNIVKFADGNYRASFIFDSPMAAGYLMTFVSFFSYVSASIPTIKIQYTYALYALSVVSCFSCFLTFSRGGLMVLVLSFAFYFLRQISFKVVLRVAILLLFIVSISSFVPQARAWALTVLDFESEASNVARMESWIDSYSLILDGEVLGYGLGALRNPHVRNEIALSTGAESTILYAGAEGGFLWAFVTALFYFYLLFRFSIAWFCSGVGKSLSSVYEKIHLATICFIIASIIYSFVFPMFVEKLTPLLLFFAVGIAIRFERVNLQQDVFLGRESSLLE